MVDKVSRVQKHRIKFGETIYTDSVDSGGRNTPCKTILLRSSSSNQFD